MLNYHDKSHREEELAKYDIVICPYNTLGSEHSDNPNGKLFSNKWRRIILDEGQKIKNRKSAISLAAFKLEADYRWVLTGTPIENKLDVLQFFKQFSFIYVIRRVNILIKVKYIENI